MDTRDGHIYRSLNDADELDLPFLKPMAVPPTERQRRRLKVGRNESCPCGSGDKFKRCCMLRLSRGEGLKIHEESAAEIKQ